MPVGWRWHVDPHHSRSSFSRSCPHRALGLPYWQEEEPCRLSDHLRSLVTLMFPEARVRHPTPEVNHCFMRLNTPPCPPLSLHPSSPRLSMCCSLPSSVTLVIITLWRLICSFWTDLLVHKKKKTLEIAMKWGKTLYWYHVKQGVDVDQRVHDSPHIVLYYLWFLWKEFWGIMGFEGIATEAFLTVYLLLGCHI